MMAAAPVSTFVRGGARRAKAERRAKLLSSMMQVAPTDEADAIHQEPILALGLQLEQVMLALDRDDAQSFRSTCKSVRAVTFAPGFAVLWREAHPSEAKGKRELARLRTYFEQLDEVETEVSLQHEITWERILPPRGQDKVSGHTSAASSSSGPSGSDSAGSPRVHDVPSSSERSDPTDYMYHGPPSLPPPPRSIGECRTPAELKRYFDDICAHDLETEPVSGAAEW